MANETIAEHEKLSTAHLVNCSVSRPVDRVEVSTTRTAMFTRNERDTFRSRWNDIQADFVDSPRKSVQKADDLVAAIIQRLAEVFSSEQEMLESNWGARRDVSTEDLRQALQHYRSFFDRLLSL